MTSSADGSVLYSINQIEEPSLSITAEEKTAVDAMGSTIASFDTAKNAEFSATNSLFDLSLLATQMGTTKQVADAGNKIVTPMFETIPVEGQTVEIKHNPVGGVLDFIYVLRADSTLGEKFKSDTAAGSATFSYDDTNKTITLPTGVTSGEIFVTYEAEVEEAVAVVGTATEYPKAGRFVLEVLGCDVCNQSELIYAYIIFHNAKLSSNVDVSFTTDGKHPFSMKAQQAYCDREKKLFSIVIPNLD